MIRWLHAPWGAGLVLALSACGGSSEGSGDTCGDPSGCGGNLVGTWKITSTCLTVNTDSMPSMGCPGSSTEVGDVTATGDVTYSSDQTYTASVTLTGNVVVTLPASCLMQQGIALTCGQVQEALRQQTSSSGDFGSATCSGASGAGCTCKVPLSPRTNNTQGTYTTSGGTVTHTQTNGALDDNDYCVRGSTLTLTPTAGDTSGTDGSFVLTKQ